MIDNYQQKNKELATKIKRANFHTKYFCLGGIVIHIKTKYTSLNFYPLLSHPTKSSDFH